MTKKKVLHTANTFKTPDEYYKQFPNIKKPKYNRSFFINNIDLLRVKLKQIHVRLFYFSWKTYADIDDYSYLINDFYDENHLKPCVDDNGYIVFSDYSLYWNSVTQKHIYINHMLSPSIVQKFNIILTSLFPNKTLGYIQKSDAITISFVDKKLKKTKLHVNIMVRFTFKKILKKEIDYDSIVAIAKKIQKKIGKNIIFDLQNVYSLKKKLEIYYEVYHDKLEDFANCFKNINFLVVPLRKIEIYRGDQTIHEIENRWTWKFT